MLIKCHANQTGCETATDKDVTTYWQGRGGSQLWCGSLPATSSPSSSVISGSMPSEVVTL